MKLGIASNSRIYGATGSLGVQPLIKKYLGNHATTKCKYGADFNAVAY
jgi:hypothetical protein